MTLSKRLQCALDWIEKDNIVADIGCDHGYLAMAALDKGVKHVQLIDNKIDPLNKAKANLKNYDNNNCCTFSLASGLTMLEEEIDTVCMLGMGGYLIRDLLIEGSDKIKSNQKFILEANNHVDVLRKYLFDNGFKIIDENICLDNKKYYELMLCVKSNEAFEYDQNDLIFGPILIKEKSAIYKSKWTEKLNKFLEIVNINDVSDVRKKIELIKENL